MLDLFELDPMTARASRALSDYRNRVHASPSSPPYGEPLEPFRSVSGKSTFVALTERASQGGPDAAFAARLADWVSYLTVARLEHHHWLAVERLADEPVLKLEDDSGFISYRRALLRALESRDVATMRARLSVFQKPQVELATAIAELAALRVEAATRLGTPHPVAEQATAAEAATEWLARTKDLARSVRANGALDRENDWASTLYACLSRDGGEGWPARLSARFLADAFPSLSKDVPITTPALAVFGATSFVRVAIAFGQDVYTALVAKSFPYVMSTAPRAGTPFRFGGLFALGLKSQAFQRKQLGLGAARADRNARALSRGMLLSSRILAAQVLLADDQKRPDEGRFAEVTYEAFGHPLPPTMRGVWPLPNDMIASRFLGLLAAHDLHRDASRVLDDDWFRNPRLYGFLADARSSEFVPYLGSESRASWASCIERATGEWERELG